MRFPRGRILEAEQLFIVFYFSVRIAFSFESPRFKELMGEVFATWNFLSS
jgi:hypothetical protein